MITSDPTWTPENVLTRPWTGHMCLQEHMHSHQVRYKRCRRIFREAEKEGRDSDVSRKLMNDHRRTAARILKKIEEIEANDD